MKRLSLATALLGLLLVACTVSVAPNRVTISPGSERVAPGGTVVLTATPNFNTTSEILWRVSGPSGSANETLSSRTGTTVTFTAPTGSNVDGEYTVTAETVDTASLPGEAVILVDSFIGAQRIGPAADAETVVLSGTLAPGELKLAVIEVSGAQAGRGQALFTELNEDLQLTMFNSDRSVYASSSNRNRFAAGTAGLSSQLLEAQSISVAQVCRGSCIIRDAAAGNYAIRIRNQGSSSVNYSLFVYIEDYKDENEPANNSISGATAFSDNASGAIESLGDIDHFRATARGTLRFNSASNLPLRAEVLSGAGAVQAELRPGDSFDRLISGDVIRVFVQGNNQAAVAARSSYTLEILPD
jgi:hypothetical protein